MADDLIADPGDPHLAEVDVGVQEIRGVVGLPEGPLQVPARAGVLLDDEAHAPHATRGLDYCAVRGGGSGGGGWTSRAAR